MTRAWGGFVVVVVVVVAFVFVVVCRIEMEVSRCQLGRAVRAHARRAEDTRRALHGGTWAGRLLLPTMLGLFSMRWSSAGTLVGVLIHASCGEAVEVEPCPNGALLCSTNTVRTLVVEPAAMASTDLDGDGEVDMLLASPDSGLTIAWGHGGGNTVVAADRAPIDVQVFIVDGSPAVFSLHTRPAELMQWHWTANKLTEEGRWPLAGSPRGLALGDLDADGQVDAVVAGAAPGSLTTLTRGFSSAQEQEFGELLNDVVLHDLDGDGDLDAAVVDLATSSLHLLLGGPEGFAAPTQILTGPAPEQLAVVAMDPGGALAVVTGGRAIDGVAVHAIDAKGAAAAAWSLDLSVQVGASPGFVVTADNAAGPWILRSSGDDLLATQITQAEVAPQIRLPTSLDGDRLQSEGQAVLLANSEQARRLEIVRKTSFVERWRGLHWKDTALASADLDADGLADLVAVSGDRLQAYRGETDMNFEALPPLSLAVSADVVLAADLTGDGAIDLAIAGEGGLQLALGTGDGRFEPAPVALADRTFRLLASINDGGAGALVLGIDDGDGESGASVVRFAADGTITAEQSIPLAGEVLAAAAGDLDGDELADVLLVRHDTGVSVSLFTARSLGADGWDEPVARAESAADYTFSRYLLGLAELDGDDRLDAVLSGAGIEVFLDIAGPAPTRVDNASLGLLNCRTMALLEVDGDGRPDLVYTARPDLGVAYNRGAGSFESGASQVLDTTAAAAVVSVEGPPALFVVDDDGLAVHALADAPGIDHPRRYPLSPRRLGQVTSGDLDGDGYPDVVASAAPRAGTEPGLAVLWGSADTRFDRGLTMDVTLFGLAAADLDGERGDELLGLEPSGALGVYRHIDGLLRLEHSQTLGEILFVVEMRTGDTDGDGNIDVMVLVTRAAEDEPWPLELLELKGLGDGDLAAPTTRWSGVTLPARGPTPGPGLVVADLDGDGLVDAAMHAGAGPQLTVAWGGGEVSTLTQRTEALGVGDMDGDGSVELLIREHSESVIVVSMVGRRVTPVTTHMVGMGSRRLIAAELDGRPPLDLLLDAFSWVNLYVGEPDGTLTSAGSFQASDVAVVDLDLDGRADVISTGGSRLNELTIRMTRNGAAP